MHDQCRRFGHGVELRIGNDDGHLKHAVGFGVQTTHLHVDPDEGVGILCHNDFEACLDAI